MRHSLLLLFLFVGTLAFSQVKVEGTPTGKHAQALNRAKETREEAKRRKQQAKETRKKVKEHKKAKKLYKEKYDSIRTGRLDSLNIKIITKEDSLAISEEVLDQTNFPDEYRELILKPPVQLDSLQFQGVDSLAINQGNAMA